MRATARSLVKRVRAEAREEVRKSRPSRAEVAATVALLFAMLAVASLREGSYNTPATALLIATVVAWMPLMVRTRLPLQVLAAVVVAESLHLAVVPFVAPAIDHPVPIASFQPVPLATMVAVWTVVTRTPRLLGSAATTAAAGTLLVVALLFRPLNMIGTAITMVEVILLTAGLGAVVAGSRERSVRREEEKVRLVAQAVTDERLRIARELHDVLAHNLALVNAQAGVAEYLLDSDTKAAAAALRGITDHTARALDELRATVGLLRRETDTSSLSNDEATVPSPTGEQLQPVPGLARLDDLVGTHRSAGTDVTVATSGAPLPLDEHSDLAAYRIIQEAITNASKHAPGQPVCVQLDWDVNRLRLRVTNPFPHKAAGRDHAAVPKRQAGTGHGLIGMRERARAAGGTFAVSSTATEHEIEASLPVNTERMRP